MNLTQQPTILPSRVQIMDASPPPTPTPSELVTSSVINTSSNDTSDHPDNYTDLNTLARRATTEIPDSIIQELVSAATQSTLVFERAFDGLRVLLGARPLCFKLRNGEEFSGRARAVRYEVYPCPVDPSIRSYKPQKTPCYTRGHEKCEMAWAVREVRRRQKKLEAFARERGGGSLVELIWSGTDVDVRTRGWRAFRRSGKRPEILKRAMFFIEESPTGRIYWMLVPKLNEDELEAVSSLWSEVTGKYADKVGAVHLLEDPLDANAEVTTKGFNPYGIFTVGEAAAHLYLLARKSVFLLVLEGRLSPSDGFRRFAQVLGKHAASFGEEMKNTDEEDESSNLDDDDQDEGDGNQKVPDGAPILEIKAIPCPVHQGAHFCVQDGVTDFNVIEGMMKRGRGYELADGTFVNTRHGHVSYRSKDAIPAYYPLPSPEDI